jgi:DEAD/DEAH box helicase domain-containing protein
MTEQSLFASNKGDSSAASKAADDVLVFDLETQKEFSEIGGRDKPELLGLSVVGVYSYKTDKLLCFEEKEIDDFRSLLEGAVKVIGFNIMGFDIKVLEPYLKGFNWQSVKLVDIFDDVYKTLGHRLSLNSIAQATLKREKTAPSGLEAVKMFREGRWDDLKNYCLEDVKLTKEIYDFGRKNRFLLYKSLDGVNNLKVKVELE